MKNLFLKIFTLIAFILCFVSTTWANDFGITSVIYDDSSSFMAINTFDNDEFQFSQLPKINIVEDEQKLYFDLSPAVLNCSSKELVINSKDIKQIAVKQLSTYPNTVRIVVKYAPEYNPKNVRLLKVNNTLILRFNQTRISNYYFQHILSDDPTAINSYYETIGIETPVLKASDNVLNQINSAFNIQTPNSQENQYILVKKDLILPTKYYLDNINIKPSAIHIIGVGSLTLTKPMYLSNPKRAVFDLHGALVNTALRNREIQLSATETIKIGQFDRNTARIVITSEQAENFVPVLYGDTQHFAFINKASTSAPQTLFGAKATLNSLSDELNDDKTHTMKLVFSKPIVYGIERHNAGLDLYLYNVDKTNNVNVKKSLIFEDTKFVALKNGGFKLSFSNKPEDIINIHAGADGKTLRIREKIVRAQLPILDDPALLESLYTKKTDGKFHIVIDPGHGGGDYGAIRENINEKDIVLEISLKVADLLRKKGYEVVMTRDVDATVSLQERVEYSENINPHIFVSIHVNSSNNEAPNGIETHYYKDNSLQLAKTVHASMLNHIKANNRGLFKSKFYVINHTTAPAILIETGFLSNPEEREQLITESRKHATAKAIAEGIHDYFKELK